MASLPTGPAVHRAVTVTIGSYTVGPAVEAGKIYVENRKVCRAFDAKTLRPIWTKTLPESAKNLLAIGSNLIYCGEPEWRKVDAKLYVLDAKTGAIRWSMARKESGEVGEDAPIAADASSIYASVRPNAVSAIDLKTHRIRWTQSYPRGQYRGLQGFLPAGKVVLIYERTNLHGLDAATGKTLWTHPDVYFNNGRIAAYGGIVWAGQEGTSKGLDLRTGKTRWTSSFGCSDDALAAQGTFVGISRGEVAALEPRTGKTLWHHPVGPKNASSEDQYSAWVGDQFFVHGLDRTIGVGAAGELRWLSPARQGLDRPVWSNGGRLTCFDGKRLLGYAPAAPEPLPTIPSARQALGRKMAREFSDLDDPEIQRLKSLGADAFAPVLEQFIRACDRYDRQSENDRSMDRYDDYHGLGDVLGSVVDRSNTNALLRAIDTTKSDSSARPFLLQSLAKVGDPDVIVPYFLNELNAKVPSFEMYESSTYVAREYIIRSRDPRAIKFMLEKLKDPKADPVLREAAYYHLAGVSEEGARAVLAERKSRTLLPSIEVRLALNDLGANERDRKVTTLIAQKADAGGHVWGLASSGILGSHGDLWLLERVDGRWTHPAFVGVSLDGISNWAKTKEPEPRAFGKTAKELAAGAWFQTVVGRPELYTDTDRDGLTDLEEARLGTDPKNPDTDGDGDSDGVDPWPNAAKRPLNDAEQVLAAVFEARHHFMTFPDTAVQFGPKDMKPFEMVGWNGPVVWQQGMAFTTPLQKCYEQGVGFLGFGFRDDNGPWTEHIQWNGDHTEASLTITTYYGGLSGDGYTAVVRKFGNDWVVVSLDQAFVS